MFTNLVLDGGDLCIIVTVVTIICHPPDGDSPLNILHQIVLLVRYASRAGLWEDNDPSLSVTCYRWEISIDCRDYKNLWIIFSSQSAARTEGPGLETPFSSSLKVSKKPLTRDPLNGIGTFESRRKQPRVDPKKRIGERLDPSAKKEETDEEEIEEVATTLRPRKTRE